MAACLSAASMACAQDGSASAQQEFERVYVDYEAAVRVGELETALALSGEVLKLGREAFGERSEPTARLTLNHAKLLQLSGRDDEAHEIFVTLIELYDELYGTATLRHVPVYMGAGQTLGSTDARMLLEAEHQARMTYFEQALSIHEAKAPDEILDYAGLVVEVADAVVTAEPGRADVVPRLERALGRVETELGEESMRLVPILMALGSAEAESRHPRRQMSHFERALEIVAEEYGDDSLEFAELSLRAGNDVLAYSHSAGSISYLEDAHEIYLERLGPEHVNTAVAVMKRGEAELAGGNASDGEEYLLESLDFFAGNSEHVGYEIRVRNSLASRYARDGRDDLADQQLLALGSITDWPSTQDYEPLIKGPPAYPRSALVDGREGTVVVEYTVDETGSVADAVVVSSEGGPGFEQAALDSLGSYRYIPRVVDGEPVAVPGVQSEIRFRIE